MFWPLPTSSKNAITMRSRFTTRLPNNHRLSATFLEALFASGRTKLDGLHDATGALRCLDRLMKDYPLTAVSVMAQNRRRRLPSGAGAGDSCRLAVCRRFVAAASSRQIRRSCCSSKPNCRFYLGNFQQARDAYGKMMNTFPKSIYVNDCLRRIMLISEYPGMDEATLRIYAEAAYAKYRFDYDSSQVLLDQLKEREGGFVN